LSLYWRDKLHLQSRGVGVAIYMERAPSACWWPGAGAISILRFVTTAWLASATDAPHVGGVSPGTDDGAMTIQIPSPATTSGTLFFRRRPLPPDKQEHRPASDLLRQPIP